MENNEKDIDINRINVIDDIFKRFTILFNQKNIKDIPSDFQKEKKICIDEIKKCFIDLKISEIIYILYSFNFAKDKSVKNIINFLDTINTILSHWEYYKQKQKKKGEI